MAVANTKLVASVGGQVEDGDTVLASDTGHIEPGVGPTFLGHHCIKTRFWHQDHRTGADTS